MRLSFVSQSQLGLVLILLGIACRRGAQSKPSKPSNPPVVSSTSNESTRRRTCCFASSRTLNRIRNGIIRPFALRMTNSSPLNSNRSSSTPIPPPPPISVPVYSLAAPLRNRIKTNPSKSSSIENNHGCLDATNNETKKQQPQQQQEGTTNRTTNTTSMNIVTFCTPVSVAPPKLWTVSLYTNTLTKMAFMTSGMGVLQLLSNHQSSLVSILGKHSGHDEFYSKQDECALVGFPWVGGGDGDGNGVVEQDVDGDHDDDDIDGSFEDIHLLPQCESYLKLKLLQTVEAGDHDLALCQVIDVGQWSEELQSVVSINRMEDDHRHQTPKDESDVLYTGQLRKESIL